MESRIKELSVYGAYKFYLPLVPEEWVLVCGLETAKGGVSIAPHVTNVVCYCEDHHVAMHGLKEVQKSEYRDRISFVVGKLDSLPFKKESIRTTCYHGINGEGDRHLVTVGWNFIDLIVESHRVLKTNGICYISFFYVRRCFLKRTKQLFDFDKLYRVKGFDWSGMIVYYPSFDKPSFVQGIEKTDLRNIKKLFFYIKTYLFGKTWGRVFEKKSTSGVALRNISFISRITRHILDKYNISLRELKKFWIGSTGSVIAEFDHHIIRFPQTQEALEHTLNNFRCLTILQQHRLKSFVPSPLAQGKVENQFFFVESKIAGISLDCYHPSEETAIGVVRQAFELLVHKTLIKKVVKKNMIRHLLVTETEKLNVKLTKEHQLLVTETLHQIWLLFQKHSLPEVVCHGDYKFSNFIIDRKSNPQLIGIIDWELSVSPGLPLYDLLTLLVFNVKPWSDYDSRAMHRLKHLVISSEREPLIFDYMKQLEINFDFFRPLGILSMVIFINKHFPITFLEKNVYHEMIDDCLVPVCESWLIG